MSMGRRHLAAFSDYLPGYQVRPTGGRQSPADNSSDLARPDLARRPRSTQEFPTFDGL